MLGLDDHLTGLADGHGLVVALLLALVLGLRHATDPDHLTAVTTLVLSSRVGGRRRALELGLAWGTGHALTLLALGLPVVLFHDALPATAQRVAECAIGLVIVVLAARLALRRRRGPLHVVGHTEAPGRRPRAAFGIGLLHGVGGSAGVGILLIGGISSPAEAVVALGLFAAATAVSMAGVSALLGAALATGPARRHVTALAPGLGAAGVLFGAWYALGALNAVPYVL